MRSQILTGGSTQVRLDGRGGRLQAELERVRAQCDVLHETCLVSHQTATQVRQEAARVRAVSRRSRGELLRACLPRDATCATVARQLVDEHLGAAAVDEIEDVKAVVSELVDNAVLHGTGKIELRVSSRRNRVLIEVIDEGEAEAARAGLKTGHGLARVRQLSLASGVRGRTTLVWAEVQVSGTGHRSPVDPSETDRRAPVRPTWIAAVNRQQPD